MTLLPGVNLSSIAPFPAGHENWLLPESYSANLNIPYYRQCVMDTDGILYTVHWRDLESEAGVYNFSPVISALNFAADNGKKMIIRVYYKSYTGTQAKPIPSYIVNDELTYGGSPSQGGLRLNSFNGYTPRFEHPAVMERFKALVAAMADEFGDHLALQGMAPDESAWSYGGLWGTSATAGLTAAQLRYAHREKCLHFQNCFPGKEIYPFYNYCDGSTSAQVLAELDWSISQGMYAGITDTHRVPQMLSGVQPVAVAYPMATKTLMCVDYMSTGNNDSSLTERYLENARTAAMYGANITAWYARGGASGNYWAAIRNAISIIG